MPRLCSWHDCLRSAETLPSGVLLALCADHLAALVVYDPAARLAELQALRAAVTVADNLTAIRAQYEPCLNGPDCDLHPMAGAGESVEAYRG